MHVVVADLDRAVGQLLEGCRRPDRIAHVLLFGDALLFRGHLKPLVEVGLAVLVDDAGQLGGVPNFFVQVLFRHRELCLGERLLQQQMRNLDFEHFLAVPQHAFVGQFLVGNLLAVDRRHDARALLPQLRIVPNVLNRCRVLQFLEQLGRHVAELVFLDAIGELIADACERHVARRNAGLALEDRELIADRNDRRDLVRLAARRLRFSMAGSPTWWRIGWIRPPMLALLTSCEFCIARRAKSSGWLDQLLMKLLGRFARR